MKKTPLALTGVAVAIAVAIAVPMLRKKRGDGDEKYRTEPVTRGPVVATVTATGSVSAVTTVQVGSQVSGSIAQLHADFNSKVRRGQLLAELDPTSFEAQVEQRRADVVRTEVEAKNAEATYERAKRLAAAGLEAKAELDSAKYAYEAAAAQVVQSRASLSQAQTNLRNTKIVSPIDGVVVDRQFDVGQTVAASFQAPTLFTIAQDLTKMQILADVDQADIGRIAVAQPARFTVDAYPEEEFRGEIAEIRLNATTNQNVVTYPVVIVVPNPGERLRPKMTANVTIEVARANNVLRVANAALRFRPLPEGKDGEKKERNGREEKPGTAAAAMEKPGSGMGAPVGGASSSADGEPSHRRHPERSEGSGGGPSSEPRADGERRWRDRGAGDGSGRGSWRRGGESADGSAPSSTSRPKPPQTVHVLDPGNKLRPVKIRTGITDGRFTEVAEGELREGENVVVGLATAKGKESAGGPMGGPMGGAGGRGGGGGGRR